MSAEAAVTMLVARPPDVIAIGASAGAIEALEHLLPALPASLAVPIVIVVHVPPDRPSGLIALFRARCQVPVQEIEDKAPLEPGVHFAPPDYHVLVERTGTFALANDEPVHYSRPAIDVLFESVAVSYHERGMGIVLSGANADGAAGLARIRQCGGITWVQQPESAAVRTMPDAALALAPHLQLSPMEMAAALRTWSARA
jgi:two-component system chemotaxis response regulator CheB